jgi:hypothetical protein
MVPNDEADADRSDVQIEGGDTGGVRNREHQPETPVILYCFNGARASNTFVDSPQLFVTKLRYVGL